jgi:hypothetical protein
MYFAFWKTFVLKRGVFLQQFDAFVKRTIMNVLHELTGLPVPPDS